MGQYHYLVNLTKKQYVHPHRIGNGLKLLEQVGWEHSTSTALVMLLAASNGPKGRGGGDFCAGPLVGSWAGDQIAFVGDYAEPTDIPGFDAAKVYAACKDGGEFKDISPQVREMMSAQFGVKYTGDGWLDISGSEPAKVADMVLTSNGVGAPVSVGCNVKL